MESTTTQRVNVPAAGIAGAEATIQVLDATMQRAWAASEPLLMLVRTDHFTSQLAVLQQLQAKALESGAWTLTGEANVIGLDGPYGSLIRGLTAFVPRIATEPGSLGVSLRHRVQQAAAPCGTLLTDFCPAFIPIFTSTTAPEALSFGFSRDRLETLLARVFAALSPRESPIVFFLRHATQADAATLRGLSRILGHGESRQIVVVALMADGAEPLDEQAWKTFVGGKRFVVERFSFGLTNAPSNDAGPHSRTQETPTLPAEMQEALEAVASHGQFGDFDSVVAALKMPAADVLLQLTKAVDASLLRRQGGMYVFVDPQLAKVCHDRMDPTARGLMHLQIGEHVAFGPSCSAPTGGAFVAASHFVIAVRDGALQKKDENTRLRVAQALLDAGRSAMTMAAHEVALQYLEAARLALIPNGDVWSSPWVHIGQQIDFARLECICAEGERVQAISLFDSLRSRVPDAPETNRAWRWMIEMATRTGNHLKAVEWAARALAPSGLRLEAAPSADVVKQAIDSVWEALGDRAVEEIADLDRMTDPVALDASETLFMVHPSAQALGSGAADLVACHLSRLALLHGNADSSSVGHVAFGAALIGRQKDHRTGTRFGKVALQLSAQRGTTRHHTAVAMKYAATMSIWTHPLQNTIDQCNRTYELALTSGDGRAAIRISSMIAFMSLLQGRSLDEVLDEALRRRRVIRGQTGDDEGMGDLCDAIERFIGQQKGRTVQRRGKSGTWNEDLRLGHAACRVIDLISLVLAQEYDAALFVGNHLRPSIAALGSQILISEYWFWTTLAATATRTTGLPADFENVQQDFERWADRCPQTFQHKRALLGAERARLEGRDLDAMRAYDQAVTEARENGFTHLEALAADIATRFYVARDFPLIAGTYYRLARNAYGRWGASTKMLQIDRRFPKLSGATDPSASIPPPAIRSSSDMDVFTAVKVAQAVSKEIVLQQLIVTLMKIVTEHVAAEKCHVLLEVEDGELNHAGKAWTTSKGLEIEVPGPVPKSMGDILPASILEHVRTTYEPVTLDEAVVDATWTDDPYISANRPRSIVCFPILRQLTIVGMFYLENNSGRGMFTPRRLALLEFLAHQAANSLEHAKLYSALARENTERRRAEQVLRKSEERLRRLVETADVIPWEFDADTNTFTFVGAQAEKRFGWPATFWSRPNFLKENVHPDDRDKALATFARACADGKHPGLDFRVIAQDGQAHWLHMVIGLVEQENGQRFLSGFFFDITERKESERTLRDKLNIIERQKNDIRTLSTPLLDVSENIVAMPVLGELDEERARRIMDVLLDTITKRNIRGAILDLTGVASISNSTAEHIGRIVRAVELLGARAIVAGIRADVARAIVSLDVGLGRIETRASMKDALRMLMVGPGGRDLQKTSGRSSR